MENFTVSVSTLRMLDPVYVSIHPNVLDALVDNVWPISSNTVERARLDLLGALGQAAQDGVEYPLFIIAIFCRTRLGPQRHA